MIEYKLMHKDAKAPIRAHETDAGMDLSTVREEVIPAGCIKLIDLGVAFNIPEGYFMQLAARSSLPLEKGLMVANGVGIIDEQYTGEVKVQLFNTTNQPVKLEAGERIAQAVLIKTDYLIPKEVQELKETERGSKGFGSSGNK